MTELTESAKRAMDAYLWRKLIPTGIAAAVLGFVANQWAEGKAVNHALSEATGPLMEASAEVAERKVETENILNQARAILDQGRAIEARLESAEAKSRQHLAKAESLRLAFVEAVQADKVAQAVAEELQRDPRFVKEVTEVAVVKLASVDALGARVIALESLKGQVSRLEAGARAIEEVFVGGRTITLRNTGNGRLLSASSAEPFAVHADVKHARDKPSVWTLAIVQGR